MKISIKVILQPNLWKPLNSKDFNSFEKPGEKLGFFFELSNWFSTNFSGYRIRINF